MAECEQVYRVSIAVDGVRQELLIPGDSEQAVRARLRADYRSGRIASYNTACGRMHVRWAKVATTGWAVVAPA